MNYNFSSGPDKLPSFIFKDFMGSFVTPLKHLINMTTKTNAFPDIWKIFRVSSILKSYDQTDNKDYRLISILSEFAHI